MSAFFYLGEINLVIILTWKSVHAKTYCYQRILGAHGCRSHCNYSQEGPLVGDGPQLKAWMRCLLQYIAGSIEKRQLHPGPKRYPRQAVTTSRVRSWPKRYGISDQRLRVIRQRKENGFRNKEKIYHNLNLTEQAGRTMVIVGLEYRKNVSVLYCNIYCNIYCQDHKHKMPSYSLQQVY